MARSGMDDSPNYGNSAFSNRHHKLTQLLFHLALPPAIFGIARVLSQDVMTGELDVPNFLRYALTPALLALGGFLIGHPHRTLFNLLGPICIATAGCISPDTISPEFWGISTASLFTPMAMAKFIPDPEGKEA